MGEKTKSFLEGSRKQGGTIGVSVSVIASWLLSTYAGINPPAEVTAAAASLVGAVGTYLQNKL